MKKPIRLALSVVLVFVALCIALGLFGIYSAGRPVVSCSNKPRKINSMLPASSISAQDYLTQGDYDYEAGNCDNAISDYTHAIELNSNFAEAYNNRAYINMVKRNYAAALPDLDRAIQLRPNYVIALMNRGDIYN